MGLLFLLTQVTQCCDIPEAAFGLALGCSGDQVWLRSSRASPPSPLCKAHVHPSMQLQVYELPAMRAKP